MREFIFGNVSGYRLAFFLKMVSFLRHFSKILLIDSVGKITEQLL